MKIIILILLIVSAFLTNEIFKLKEQLRDTKKNNLQLSTLIQKKQTSIKSNTESLVTNEIIEKFKTYSNLPTFEPKDVKPSPLISNFFEVKTKSNQIVYLHLDSKMVFLGPIIDIKDNQIYNSEIPQFSNMMKLRFDKNIERFFLELDQSKIKKNDQIHIEMKNDK